MSAIVRMEMPFSCAVCRCHSDGWCYLLSIQPSECTYDRRPSWCPIIGVLPEQHGRLVDADDVNNHIIGYVDLRDCPTIVPATERSET